MIEDALDREIAVVVEERRCIIPILRMKKGQYLIGLQKEEIRSLGDRSRSNSDNLFVVKRYTHLPLTEYLDEREAIEHESIQKKLETILEGNPEADPHQTLLDMMKVQLKEEGIKAAGPLSSPSM